MELKKRLGKRIQELRLKHGLKQSELAEKVGIATKHQSCVETGKNYPSAELIENYAKVFNIDVSEVLSINHIKTKSELTDEIDFLVKQATDYELTTIYRILNSIINH